MKSLIQYIIEANNQQNFPRAQDYEILIAAGLNLKSIGTKYDRSSKDIIKSFKYALFAGLHADKGDLSKVTMDNIDELVGDLSKDNQDKLDKFVNYYLENNENIDKLVKNSNIKTEDGELYCKCHQSQVKQDVSDEYKKYGDYGEKSRVNHTPKTDLISSTGKKISVKKSAGSQAMSGAMHEAMGTMMQFKHLLDKDDAKKLESMFDYDWYGNDSDRNKKLNSIIKDIFSNPKNVKFMTAVTTESLTGSGKFKEDSIGVPDMVLSFSKDKIIIDDMDSYIYHTVTNAISKNKNIISVRHKRHKSGESGERCASLRVDLPKHGDEPYSIPDDKDEDIMSTIKDSRKCISSREYEVSKRQQKDKEDKETKEREAKLNDDDDSDYEEDTDENGNPRQYKTGSRGGRYYRVKINGVWGPWHSVPAEK